MSGRSVPRVVSGGRSARVMMGVSENRLDEDKKPNADLGGEKGDLPQQGWVAMLLSCHAIVPNK
jgi:hypothetical protein